MGASQSMDYHDVDASVPRGLNYQAGLLLLTFTQLTKHCLSAGGNVEQDIF